MTKCKSLLALVVALLLTAALVGTSLAQTPAGRGPGMARFGGLLGLVRSQQIHQELKLTEDQVTKVTEIGETLGGEMRERFAALRDTQDRSQWPGAMTEVINEFDRKAREQLRDVLNREQMMRLFQIRMQVRPVADSLTSEWIANRLQITPEQKEKLNQITQETQAKQMELFASMRDASDDQRNELRQKLEISRNEANEKALGVLTEEQKTSFKEMQGEKFEWDAQ